MSSKTFAGNWGNMFPDDLAIIDDEHIIFSDMSGKCGEDRLELCFLEYVADGRQESFKIKLINNLV
jgi:hypothetical protein